MSVSSIEHRLVHALRTQKTTLATAESCTGGLIGHRITTVSGASECYVGGVIAYSNEVKIRLLGVDENTLRLHGAVSDLVAKEMASGVRNVFQADWGIGVTGIAGPTGASKNKPVGTVFIAIAGPSKIIGEHHVFHGDRDTVKYQTSERALQMLWEILA